METKYLVIGGIGLVGSGLLAWSLNRKESPKTPNVQNEHSADKPATFTNLINSKSADFTENKRLYSIADTFRQDVKGTKYRLIYPFLVNPNLQTGLTVEKVELIYKNVAYNESNGSAYAYSLRKVVQEDEFMRKLVLTAKNREGYVDAFGKPYDFATVGDWMMLVKSQKDSQLYLVPIIRNFMGDYSGQIYLEKI